MCLADDGVTKVFKEVQFGAASIKGPLDFLNR